MNELESLKEQNALANAIGGQAIVALEVLVSAFQDQYCAEDNSVDQIYDALSNIVLQKMVYLYQNARFPEPTASHWVSLGSFFEWRGKQSFVNEGPELSRVSAVIDQQVERLLTQIDGQVLDYKDLDLGLLGVVYEQLMEASLVVDPQGQIQLVEDDQRRRTGAHYTPRVLCDFLVEESMRRLLSSKASAEDILALKICDPAMGAGAFLLSVLRNLAERLMGAWEREGKTDKTLEMAKRLVAENCLFGVDINPYAVSLAKICLCLEVGSPSVYPNSFALSLQEGNSLLDSSSGRYPVPKEGFEWKERFPMMWCGERNGFDLVIGNPPFINCIRGKLDPFVKRFIKKRYPLITGAADLSYYFLELGTELIQVNGILSLILPRVSMGAKALRAFRRSTERPKPVLIYSPEHYAFFYNADIKTAVYIFGESKRTLVSNAPFPTEKDWTSLFLDREMLWPLYKGNWWVQFSLACAGENIPNTLGAKALRELGFEVHGGLTTGDFYEICVVEKEQGTELKLLTSGGIDPNCSFWGKKECYQTFRKQRFRYPRIQMISYPQSLQRKLDRSRRPKIIIANLTKTLEAFLDRDGEYQGATATQTIYHQSDSIEKLEELCALFHSDYGNLLFHHVLRYNAMHSNISVEKEFLLDFPVPDS